MNRYCTKQRFRAYLGCFWPGFSLKQLKLEEIHKMTMPNKTQIANIVLWTAYILALAASLTHVAWAFGTLEFPGQQWNGWLAAIAVDAGLAALAYGIQQRRRTKRPERMLWVGVIVFASISAFANLLHALTVQTGGTVVLSSFGQVDPLLLVQAVVLSATLPLLVVYLGEVVSSDDAEASKAAEAEAKREAREQKRIVQFDAISDQKSANEIVLDGVNEQKKLDKVQAMDALETYLVANPDTSLAEAGQEIGRSKSTVGNYVTELETAGRLTKNGNGWEVVTQ